MSYDPAKRTIDDIPVEVLQLGPVAIEHARSCPNAGATGYLEMDPADCTCGASEEWERAERMHQRMLDALPACYARAAQVSDFTLRLERRAAFGQQVHGSLGMGLANALGAAGSPFGLGGVDGIATRTESAMVSDPCPAWWSALAKFIGTIDLPPLWLWVLGMASLLWRVL